MKKHLHSLFCLFALASGLMLTAQAAPVIGQPAPAFTLNDSTGKSHQLADFKGKTVVLEWTNYDCPFVMKHYSGGAMQKLQAEFTAKGVIWLSICSSAPGKQGNFDSATIEKRRLESKAVPTAYLIDADGKVGKAYEAKTTPHMFVINPEGKLIYMGAIDSIKSVDSADVAKATNYVSQALNEALSGKPVSVAETKSYGCGVKY